MLFELVERYVKPQRLLDNREQRSQYWWRHGERQTGLYVKIQFLKCVLALSIVSPQFAIAILPNGLVYAHSIAIFAFDRLSALAVLQSRAHELWARFFASSMKDDLRYTPSDCFRTFPFPEEFLTNNDLGAAGEAYNAHRAALMVAHNEGLTKTYNRFHDRREPAADIQRLRDLHAEMDRAVLTAYGWTDFAESAAPEFISREDDPDKTRLDWPQAFKDQVLARLLDLNRSRAAEEARLGLASGSEDEADADDNGGDEES